MKKTSDLLGGPTYAKLLSIAFRRFFNIKVILSDVKKDNINYNTTDSRRAITVVLTLSDDKINNYAEKNKVSKNEAINKTFAHHILHILFEINDSKYNDYDQKILHIAQDLEINQLIGMGNPELQPEDFNLPCDLDFETYYEMLLATKENNEDHNEKIKNFKSDNSIYDKIKEVCNIGETNVNIYSFKKTAKKIYQNVLNKDLKLVIKELDRRENQITINKIQKKLDWTKYNNRKEDEFILPGRITISNGTSRKYKESAIFFIDISGSTISIRQDLEELCTFLKNKFNPIFVFYNNSFVSCLNPDDEFEIPNSFGGTSFKESLEQWNSKYCYDLTSRHIYVFTDGLDESLPECFEKYPYMKAWYLGINKGDNNIKEITKDNVSENKYIFY